MNRLVERNGALLLLLLLLTTSLSIDLCHGFSIRAGMYPTTTTTTTATTATRGRPFHWLPRQQQQQSHSSSAWLRLRLQQQQSDDNNNVMDADFEPVPSSTSTLSSSTFPDDYDDDDDAPVKSLLEWSWDSDPELRETRIPFFDPDDNHRSIDARLAFMVVLDGIEYAIGVPFDACAAVTLEIANNNNNNKEVQHLSPDDSSHEEYFALMAEQLSEHVGDDLQLHHTPRILTISGPLDKYTKDWRETVLPKSFDAATLLDDSDEDLEFFHRIMKEELGEEEYHKTLAEEHFFDDDTMALFSSNNNNNNNDDELSQLLESLVDSETPLADFEAAVASNLVHDGVALKLVSFRLKDEPKTYSLVQLLQPVALIARTHTSTSTTTSNNNNNYNNIRFELLSHEEHALIAPLLEQVAQKELQQAGLQLHP